MIGTRLKHDFAGGDAWVLSYREECFDQIGLKPSLRTPLYNGSLECELRKYQMFSGKFNEMRAQGGNIKTAQERRMMADRKRFKQKRDFKEKLEDDPRERFTRKKDREDFRRDEKRGGRDTRRGDKNERWGDRDDRRGGRDTRRSDHDGRRGERRDNRRGGRDNERGDFRKPSPRRDKGRRD